MNSSNSWPLLIAVKDPALQVYLQQFPFACGPDHEMNRRAFAEAKASLRHMRGLSCANIEALDREALTLLPEEIERVNSLFSELGINTHEGEQLVEDFAWRVGRIPRRANRVLSIGCGAGHELLFIRAVLPLAEIVAIDYVQKLLPGLADKAEVKFVAGDLNSLLSNMEPGAFDVAFSNHTLEHMYDPDSIIAHLSRLLTQEGCLVSGMPLDAIAMGAFADQISSLYAAPASMHPVEASLFDFGHPWKADAQTLTDSLLRSGLSDTRIFQRAYQLGRMAPGDARAYERMARQGTTLNRLVFGTARWLLKHSFPNSVPYTILRIMHALERRCWFGTSRLKNWLAPDVVFVAKRAPVTRESS